MKSKRITHRTSINTERGTRAMHWVRLDDCCNTPDGKKAPKADALITISVSNLTLDVKVIMKHPCGIMMYHAVVTILPDGETIPWEWDIHDSPAGVQQTVDREVEWGTGKPNKLPVSSLTNCQISVVGGVMSKCRTQSTWLTIVKLVP